MAVGDDGLRVRAQEAGRVVADALPGDGDGRLRVARLRVARCVAQVVEHHDRVRGEVQRAHVRLAVIAVLVVGQPPVAVGVGVESEAVLRRVLGVVRVRARPAVAVAEVDEDGRPDRGGLDPRPRGVRAVHLDDVGRVPARLGVGRIRPRSIRRRGAVRGADHDHDLGRAQPGRGARVRRDRQRTGDHGRREQGDDEGSMHRRSAGWGMTDRFSLASIRGPLNRGMVPAALATSALEGWGPVPAGAVCEGRVGQRPARRRTTRSPSGGLARSRSDRIGRPSAVTWSTGHGTAATGSSQANPSSSVPS